MSLGMLRWAVLIACVASFMVVGASQLACVSPSVPIFMDVFGLSAAVAGLMTSTWALARVVISLPAGGIIYRFGSRYAYVLGVVLSTVGWGIKSIAPDYLIILVGRFIAGLGAGILSVAAPVVISEWFPAKLLSTAMGVWATAMPIGIIWELPLIAWLITNFGWRHTYLLFTIASASTLAFLALVFRAPPPYLVKSNTTILKPKVIELLRNKAFIASCTSIFLGMGLWSTYSTYIVKWCMVKGFDYMTSSLVGTILNVGCIVSQVVTGYVSDKLLGGRLRPVFMSGAVLASLTTIAYALTTSLSELMITAAIIGVGIAPITVSMFAIPLKAVKPEMRGMAMGVTGVFMYSAYVMTSLIGGIYDVFGLMAAASMISFMGMLSAAVIHVGTRSYKV